MLYILLADLFLDVDTFYKCMFAFTMVPSPLARPNRCLQHKLRTLKKQKHSSKRCFSRHLVNLVPFGEGPHLRAVAAALALPLGSLSVTEVMIACALLWLAARPAVRTKKHAFPDDRLVARLPPCGRVIA